MRRRRIYLWMIFLLTVLSVGPMSAMWFSLFKMGNAGAPLHLRVKWLSPVLFGVAAALCLVNWAHIKTSFWHGMQIAVALFAFTLLFIMMGTLSFGYGSRGAIALIVLFAAFLFVDLFEDSKDRALVIAVYLLLYGPLLLLWQ